MNCDCLFWTFCLTKNDCLCFYVPVCMQVLLHNMFYTTLGTIQWSLTEVAFIYCYMTGRLSFHPILSSTAETLHLIAWCLAIPVTRDVHFYFCHRVLHTRFLYKYFHTVHHRNIDTEPFSGLTMHPMEHLYYFACYGPFLWAGEKKHPFLVFWMGVHALISPVGGHSGYEDHWSSDVFHYMHHRYFDCNYGSLGIPLDYWFGTFKDKLEPVDHLNNVEEVNAKANLNGSPQNIPFLVFGAVVPVMALWWCLQRNDMSPLSTAFSIAATPILAAAVLHWPSKSISLWNHYLHPFHENSAFSCFLHLAVGLGMCCIFPVASLIKLLLVEPESAL
jgi:sterol desaturase/sphingolipid hydroxylase (fatty acid hydroxylase superfamily)